MHCILRDKTCFLFSAKHLQEVTAIETEDNPEARVEVKFGADSIAKVSFRVSRAALLNTSINYKAVVSCSSPPKVYSVIMLLNSGTEGKRVLKRAIHKRLWGLSNVSPYTGDDRRTGGAVEPEGVTQT